MVKNWLGIATIVMIMWGCAATPQQESYEKARAAYNDGEDAAALEYTLKSLKIKPDYKPALELLSQIYDNVARSHLLAVEKLEGSSKGDAASRWEQIVDHLEKIESVNKELDAVSRQNADLGIRLYRVDEQMNEALDSAAYWNFQYGLDEMEKNTKVANRNAAIYFSRALEYDKDYPEAQKLYDLCRRNGMAKMLVDKLRGDYSHRLDGDIISGLRKDRDASEFISFINRDNLDRLLEEQGVSLSGDFIEESEIDMVGRLLDAQYVVVGGVEKAACADRPEVESSSKEVSATVATGRKKCTTTTNSKGLTQRSCSDVYATVYGTLVTDSLRRKASIAGNLRILDVSKGEVVKDIDVRAGVMSTSEKQHCHGSREACRGVKIKSESTLRPCSELADQLIVDFAKKAVKGISAYAIKLTN